ncbi:Transcriptional repressor SmtB homolog (fragment) [Hyella patelloides LEGE 07179]|uniref:Transcriptional repressor SmtB homolog n=1 Tax=Hyella patelloides LEGE 07179 TaxID=945734 RepID=A0A563VZM7_9CYAN
MSQVSQSKQQDSSEFDAPSCDSSLVHLERIRQVQSSIVTTEKAQQMAQFLVQWQILID